jgi:4-hydroxybutyrate dehydrogenase/sulfolactaldehyde 3-reductase
VRQIGFVGIGTMGAPMARNLLRGGFALRVFDLSSEAMAGIVQHGAVATRSPAEAASEAECVITMLPNSADVEKALLGPDGIATTLARGALHIDMSTIAPATTDRLARALAERGIDMVDAPVGRSSQHAIEGKLLIMAGGSNAAVARARPVLEKLGDTIVHCGPVGSGARAKLVNNFTSIASCALAAEALALAEASGLDPAIARQIMLGTPAGMGHLSTTYAAKVLKGDLSPGFMVDLAWKDLGLALDLAHDLGVPVPTGAASKAAYDEARSLGRGRQDWTALYAIARERLKR